MSDDELVAHVKDCLSSERRATAALVASLSELEIRRLHLAAGFRSLFDYCVRHLHLSEQGAYSRIQVARLVRRFPVVLELLADARVSLTAIAKLAAHLTEANHKVLLEKATHKTVAEVEVIIATLNPQPDVASLVRRLPGERLRPAAVSAGLSPASSLLQLLPSAQSHADPASTAAIFPPEDIPMAAASPVRPSPRDVVRPLAAERYKVQFTISLNTRTKLRAAQDLLRHSIPGGDIGQIFDRALTLLLVDLEKKRFGAVAKPRPEPRAVKAGTRHIPAAVRREVWRRDKGRCAFVGTEGRCRERAHLELHHVKPFAAGGASTATNIQLRCRAHNQHEAVLLASDG